MPKITYLPEDSFEVDIQTDELLKRSIATLIELKESNQSEDADIEKEHIQADEILCDFLLHLGYKELVDEFQKIWKWYA